MSKSAEVRPNAWLLDFGQTLRAAVGMRVMMQIIDSPKLHVVPGTPPYCHSVFSWQGQLLPVIDLAVVMGQAAQKPHLLGVVGYQEHPGDATRFGAFLLSAPPQAIIVGNDQECALPDPQDEWSRLSVSCFGHQGDAIPVLHLGRIFSRLPGSPSRS